MSSDGDQVKRNSAFFDIDDVMEDVRKSRELSDKATDFEMDDDTSIDSLVLESEAGQEILREIQRRDSSKLSTSMASYRVTSDDSKDEDESQIVSSHLLIAHKLLDDNNTAPKVTEAEDEGQDQDNVKDRSSVADESVKSHNAEAAARGWSSCTLGEEAVERALDAAIHGLENSDDRSVLGAEAIVKVMDDCSDTVEAALDEEFEILSSPLNSPTRKSYFEDLDSEESTYLGRDEEDHEDQEPVQPVLLPPTSVQLSLSSAKESLMNLCLPPDADPKPLGVLEKQVTESETDASVRAAVVSQVLPVEDEVLKLDPMASLDQVVTQALEAGRQTVQDMTAEPEQTSPLAIADQDTVDEALMADDVNEGSELSESKEALEPRDRSVQADEVGFEASPIIVDCNVVHLALLEGVSQANRGPEKAETLDTKEEGIDGKLPIIPKDMLDDQSKDNDVPDRDLSEAVDDSSDFETTPIVIDDKIITQALLASSPLISPKDSNHNFNVLPVIINSESVDLALLEGAEKSKKVDHGHDKVETADEEGEKDQAQGNLVLPRAHEGTIKEDEGLNNEVSNEDSDQNTKTESLDIASWVNLSATIMNTEVVSEALWAGFMSNQVLEEQVKVEQGHPETEDHVDEKSESTRAGPTFSTPVSKATSSLNLTASPIPMRDPDEKEEASEGCNEDSGIELIHSPTKVNTANESLFEPPTPCVVDDRVVMAALDANKHDENTEKAQTQDAQEEVEKRHPDIANDETLSFDPPTPIVIPDAIVSMALRVELDEPELIKQTQEAEVEAKEAIMVQNEEDHQDNVCFRPVILDAESVDRSILAGLEASNVIDAPALESKQEVDQVGARSVEKPDQKLTSGDLFEDLDDSGVFGEDHLVLQAHPVILSPTLVEAALSSAGSMMSDQKIESCADHLPQQEAEPSLQDQESMISSDPRFISTLIGHSLWPLQLESNANRLEEVSEHVSDIHSDQEIHGLPEDEEEEGSTSVYKHPGDTDDPDVETKTDDVQNFHDQAETGFEAFEADTKDEEEEGSTSVKADPDVETKTDDVQDFHDQAETAFEAFEADTKDEEKEGSTSVKDDPDVETKTDDVQDFHEQAETAFEVFEADTKDEEEDTVTAKDHQNIESTNPEIEAVIAKEAEAAPDTHLKELRGETVLHTTDTTDEHIKTETGLVTNDITETGHDDTNSKMALEGVETSDEALESNSVALKEELALTVNEDAPNETVNDIEAKDAPSAHLKELMRANAGHEEDEEGEEGSDWNILEEERIESNNIEGGQECGLKALPDDALLNETLILEQDEAPDTNSLEMPEFVASQPRDSQDDHGLEKSDPINVNNAEIAPDTHLNELLGIEDDEANIEENNHDTLGATIESTLTLKEEGINDSINAVEDGISDMPIVIDTSETEEMETPIKTVALSDSSIDNCNPNQSPYKPSDSFKDHQDKIEEEIMSISNIPEQILSEELQEVQPTLVDQGTVQASLEAGLQSLLLSKSSLDIPVQDDLAASIEEAQLDEENDIENEVKIEELAKEMSVEHPDGSTHSEDTQGQAEASDLVALDPESTPEMESSVINAPDNHLLELQLMQASHQARPSSEDEMMIRHDSSKNENITEPEIEPSAFDKLDAMTMNDNTQDKHGCNLAPEVAMNFSETPIKEPMEATEHPEAASNSMSVEVKYDDNEADDVARTVNSKNDPSQQRHDDVLIAITEHSNEPLDSSLEESQEGFVQGRLDIHPEERRVSVAHNDEPMKPEFIIEEQTECSLNHETQELQVDLSTVEDESIPTVEPVLIKAEIKDEVKVTPPKTENNSHNLFVPFGKEEPLYSIPEKNQIILDPSKLNELHEPKEDRNKPSIPLALSKRQTPPGSPAKPARKSRKDLSESDKTPILTQPRSNELEEVTPKPRRKARSVSKSRISISSVNEQRERYKQQKQQNNQQSWMEYLFGPCCSCMSKK